MFSPNSTNEPDKYNLSQTFVSRCLANIIESVGVSQICPIAADAGEREGCDSGLLNFCSI